MEPLGRFLEYSMESLESILKAPLGKTLGQKPSGPAAPRVFGRGSGLRCGFGFAFGKSFGVPSIYSLGNRLRILGTSLGNSFTTLHPRLFNRLYQTASWPRRRRAGRKRWGHLSTDTWVKECFFRKILFTRMIDKVQTKP